MAGKSKKTGKRRRRTVTDLALTLGGDAHAFQAWVRGQGGIAAVAELLDVKVGAVKCWHARQGWPTTSNVLKILAAADGAFEFQDLIASTAKLPQAERPGPGRRPRKLQ